MGCSTRVLLCLVSCAVSVACRTELTIVAGLYIKGDWSWRMPCLMQFVGPVAVLALTFTAPESPRVSSITS